MDDAEDQRPSRQLRKQRAAAAKAEEPPILRFDLDGELYELRPGAWSWRDEQELYSLTKLGWPRLIAEIQSGNGSPYILGCLVFLVIRGRGEQITFDAAQQRTAGNPVVIFDPEDDGEEVDPGPEDQGSDGGPTSQP